VLIVSSTQNFNAKDRLTQEAIRQGLNDAINLAFRCINNPSLPNCTRTNRQRYKRQACSNGYRVNLLADIIQVIASDNVRFVCYVSCVCV
jgi:hypothetical protein